MTEFSVKGLRSFIDQSSLPSHHLATSWNKIVPKKVNIHAWRVVKNRLPTKFNLWFRGVHHNSLICPCCGNGIETLFHIISYCHIAKMVWKAICIWLNMDIPFYFDPADLIQFVNNMNKAKVTKDIVITIIFTIWWELWKFKNDVAFNPSKRRYVGEGTTY